MSLLKTLLISYFLGAILALRIKGNFSIKMNKFFSIMFLLGLEKIISFDSENNKTPNLLPIIWQIATMIYVGILPLFMKCVKNRVPEMIIQWYIQSFNYIGKITLIYYIVFSQ